MTNYIIQVKESGALFWKDRANISEKPHEYIYDTAAEWVTDNIPQSEIGHYRLIEIHDENEY